MATVAARLHSEHDAVAADDRSCDVVFPLSDRAAARFMRLYARVIGGGAHVQWSDSEGRRLAERDVPRALGCADDRRRPVVVVYWIKDALAVVTLPFAAAPVREIVRQIRLLPDDTFGGRVSAAFFRGIGGRFRLLALPGDSERLRQLSAVIRAKEPCAFAIDGGGPYGNVGTGVVRLAAAMGANIVPIAVRASPSVRVSLRSRVRLPLPRCRIAAVVGRAIALDSDLDRRAVADRIRRSLDELSDIADRELRRRTNR